MLAPTTPRKACAPSSRSVRRSGEGLRAVSPGKVFRTELNPVDLLRRAAYIYPDKGAVGPPARRYSYRPLAETPRPAPHGRPTARLRKGDRTSHRPAQSPPSAPG